MATNKKIHINRKPDKAVGGIESWVSDRTPLISSESEEKMKRLTLDVPESLHKAIKRKAVESGVTMADLLRELLEQHFKE